MVGELSKLYTSELSLGENKLYFGFEKVDKKNIEFWKLYGSESSDLARRCSTLVSIDSENLLLAEISKLFACQQEKAQEMLAFIQKKNFQDINPFDGRGIQGSAAEFSRTLLSGSHVVYVSTKPITKRNKFTQLDSQMIYSDRGEKKLRNINSILSFKQFFGDIVMSFKFTNQKSSCVTHFGIFRNPLDFFDPAEKNKGLSMILHGFAAKVVMTNQPQKKIYMVNQPMDCMAAIFCRALSKGELFLGSNQDLFKEFRYDKRNSEGLEKYELHQKLMAEFPPIYHIEINASGNEIHKLAAEGTNLKDYPTQLPDELTQVSSDQQLFSGTTFNALTAVSKLAALAKFYLGDIEELASKDS